MIGIYISQSMNFTSKLFSVRELLAFRFEKSYKLSKTSVK